MDDHSEAEQRIREHLLSSRVIAHIDMDCFFCQVEQLRLGVPADQPLAVLQWNGLIAVNYAARAKGVSRHDTAAEARAKCPEIRLVHVATYTPGGQAGYHENPAPNAQKAELNGYRQASKQIMSVIEQFCDHTEKASIGKGRDDSVMTASSLSAWHRY
ncbi:N-acetyltransferase eso1 [Spiromyces aspiralis]|uniref:N-acetyltransferase eso1 n=1 Tax=Spiromyces aspiralis TaxID=68401 RepID=A0ACC1H7K6_9FUNG|nr:N-acetyltransferase eso1 [Spiromyces aspiralis]